MKETGYKWAGVVLGGVLLLGVGCAKKVSTVTGEATAGKTPSPRVEEVRPAPLPPPIEEAGPQPERGAAARLSDVYFDFDQATIRDDARRVLEQNVRWLESNQKAKIRIEGHADERGDTEYNLTLGEKRAQMTRRFLAAAGIDARRVETISYGEERPACREHQEECWWKNRRAHFDMTAQ